MNGYRKIAELLRRAGWLINDKRVERIWRREGLKVPRKQPKRGRLTRRRFIPTYWPDAFEAVLQSCEIMVGIAEREPDQDFSTNDRNYLDALVSRLAGTLEFDDNRPARARRCPHRSSTSVDDREAAAVANHDERRLTSATLSL